MGAVEGLIFACAPLFIITARLQQSGSADQEVCRLSLAALERVGG